MVAAQAEHFDLFLLDSQFSDGNGLELCRRLRHHFLRSPIFFYSHRAYESDRKNGLDAGADEYLIKPDSDNLPEWILSAVRFSRKNEKKRIKNTFIKSQNEEQRKAAGRILKHDSEVEESLSKKASLVN